MSLWTLAADGRHDALTFGMPIYKVIERYGRPSNYARNRRGWLTIVKYDDIELHAQGGLLWLVHCEFGTPPLPVSVSSAILGIEPGPFRWPTDSDAVIHAAQAAGFEPTIGELLGSDTPVTRFGFAEFSHHQEEEFCVLSILDNSILDDDVSQTSSRRQRSTS